jgi:heme/copper-type cytochrome/quinol oxidase subunit 2
LAVWALFVLAATRHGWLGRLGALLTFLTAGFYAFAGQLGEIKKHTSPLTGAKWDVVLVLGSIGIAIALVVMLACVYMVVLEIVGRVRTRRPHPT